MQKDHHPSDIYPVLSAEHGEKNHRLLDSIENADDVSYVYEELHTFHMLTKI